MPDYIRKLFKDGAPADFILIGATTRQPEEINPAIRSRCAVHRVNAAEEPENPGEWALAEEYLRALGDEAALLRCCNSLERMTAAEFRDFITLLRLTAAETLTGKELLSLQRELERIAEMLRVNVSVRHAVGLLWTYRYEP